MKNDAKRNIATCDIGMLSIEQKWHSSELNSRVLFRGSSVFMWRLHAGRMVENLHVVCKLQ